MTDLDRMEIEDFHRKKSFAQLYALGVPLMKAVRSAGFDNPKREMIAKLLADSFVLDEIEKALAALRNQLLQQKELIIAQLDSDRELAYNQENPAAAVAATIGKAKVLGLLDRPGEKNMPSKIVVEWGEESTETIYEKSNPLLYEAVAETVGK
jgi:hypothetical protein